MADIVGESLASTVPLKRCEDWEKIAKQRKKRETVGVRELAIAAPSQYGNKFYPASEDGTLRTAMNGRGSTAVPSSCSAYSTGISDEYIWSRLTSDECRFSSSIKSCPDVGDERYYAPSPAFSSFTLNASQTSLDNYLQIDDYRRG